MSTLNLNGAYIETTAQNNSLAGQHRGYNTTLSMLSDSSLQKQTASEDESLSTYRQLQRTEKTRRRLLIQGEDHIAKTLLRWDGTCLSLILSDPLLWLNMLLFVLMRVLQENGTPKFFLGLSVGSNGNVNVIGGFLSFFLVYFVVESSKRFNEQYDLCMEAKGCVLDFASLARSHLERNQGLKLVRYMNAAYAAGFVGLSDVYSYKGFFLHYNKQAIVLTDRELERVEACNMDEGGSCYREILQWIQLEIKDALDRKVIDSLTAKQFRVKILGLQGAMSRLFNFADQPIIFFYIHFISLLSVLYLPLFTLNTSEKLSLTVKNWMESSLNKTGSAETVSKTADFVAGSIVFLQTIFVIGLRILGQKLMDPFGDDFEDLSVMYYITFTWKNSARIMAAEPTPIGENSMTESEILLKRAPIGAAWDVNLKPTNNEPDDAFEDCHDTVPNGEKSMSTCIIQ